MAAPNNRVQQIQLELLRISGFNALDGERVVADLENNRDLWDGVLMTRSDPLLLVRDLGEGVWNADTLYLRSSGVNDRGLEALAQGWEADELGWVRHQEGFRVLVLWWD